MQIHDILVLIRIRIRGFMPQTNGSECGSGSCYFRHWPSRRQQKTNFEKVFLLITFEVTFTSFFKDKKSKRSHKTVEVKVFLTIFANWLKDPDPDPWGPKHVDPDSQHCLWIINFWLFLMFELLECRKKITWRALKARVFVHNGRWVYKKSSLHILFQSLILSTPSQKSFSLYPETLSRAVLKERTSAAAAESERRCSSAVPPFVLWFQCVRF